MTVGCRRSGLNQNMALKEQFDQALQDLADLVDTAKDKMASDHRIIASSVEEVQSHLDKHKVRKKTHTLVTVHSFFFFNRHYFMYKIKHFYDGINRTILTQLCIYLYCNISNK